MSHTVRPTKDQLRRKILSLEREIKERGVASIAMFGSAVRGDTHPDSDVDLLIDIEPGFRFSLIDLVDLKLFLEEHLGQEVDVAIREGLDPAVRENVRRDEERVF